MCVLIHLEIPIGFYRLFTSVASGSISSLSIIMYVLHTIMHHILVVKYVILPNVLHVHCFLHCFFLFFFFQIVSQDRHFGKLASVGVGG